MDNSVRAKHSASELLLRTDFLLHSQDSDSLLLTSEPDGSLCIPIPVCAFTDSNTQLLHFHTPLFPPCTCFELCLTRSPCQCCTSVKLVVSFSHPQRRGPVRTVLSFQSSCPSYLSQQSHGAGKHGLALLDGQRDTAAASGGSIAGTKLESKAPGCQA